MSTLGSRISDYRRKNGLTQAQLAEKLDVSFQAVSSWERDEYMPDTKKLKSLAEIFDVSLSNLIDDERKQFAAKKELFDWKHMKTFVKTIAKDRQMKDTLAALVFAEEAHSGQRRKKSDIPYIYHPLNLACHCLALGIYDDEIVAACLLHDVVEDCNVNPDELPVGPEARQLVSLLTHEKDDSRRKQIMDKYYEGIAGNPKSALIKCIDRCNNLTTMSWGLTRDKIYRYIDETEQYIYPLLQVVKNAPEFNDAAWLLKYQIGSMLDIYKRLL